MSRSRMSQDDILPIIVILVLLAAVGVLGIVAYGEIRRSQACDRGEVRIELPDGAVKCAQTIDPCTRTRDP